jgi:membrane-bound lytic murein transglycosylase B
MIGLADSLRRLVPLALAVVLLPCAAMPPVGEAPFLEQRGGFDLNRPEIQGFVSMLVSRHGFARGHVLETLADAEPQPRILELIARPAERVAPWWRYRSNFLSAGRIDGGASFWNTHRATLERAERQTGVPAAYIIAIIGVETSYGRVTGSWRALDALMTLGFDYPPRAPFFRDELEQLLLLARDERLDAGLLRGSYAGALGPPQFMPSSYRRYAIDADGDGRRDLLRDWDDVIVSVANYFSAHGWGAGSPVLLEASSDAATFAQLDFRNLDLNETLGSLRSKGVKFISDLPDTTRAILLPAELESGPNVRIGLGNFKVITEYNRSIRYAMAVHDLATDIARRVAAG